MAATDQQISDFLDADDNDSPDVSNFIEPDASQGAQEASAKDPQDVITAPPSELTQGAFDVAQGFNDAFLNLLDVPNDLFDWTAEKLDSDLRVGSIRNLSASTIGVGTREGEERKTGSYRAGKYLGMGLEFLAPILRFGKTAGAIAHEAPGTTKRVAQVVTQPFVTTPKKAAAIEVAAGLSSGYGSFYGEEEYGQIGGQLGGLLGGIFPSLSTIPAQYMKNYALKSIFPFTDAGSNAKAGEIIRQIRETPGVSEQIAKEESRILAGTKQTSFRLTKDPHLIALEKTLIKDRPELDHQLRMIDAENNVISQNALRNLGGDGEVEDAIRSLGSTYTKLKIRLDLRVDNALRKTQEKIAEISPKNKRQAANIEVNNQIRTALEDARKSENILWEKVNKTAIASTSNSKSTLRRIMLEMEEEADKALVPKFINEFMGRVRNGELVGGKWGETRHVGGIQTLRSRTLQEIKNEKYGESVNWNRVRIMEDLEKSMLDDMASSPTSTGLDDALQFSRQLNQRFKGDIMSMILRNNQSGGSLAPELTLDSLGAGPKGAFYIKRIIDASPDSKANIEDVLKMDIIKNKIVKEDGLNIQKAKDYMGNNEETMKMFPALKEDMENAITLAEVHKYFQGTREVRLKKAEKALGYSLADKTQPGTFLNKIINSKNPEKSMARILRQVNEKGVNGIKNDIIESVFKNAKVSSELVGKEGQETFRVSGAKALGYWNENKQVLSKAFSKEEMSRMDVILNTLRLGDTPKSLPVGVAEKALIPKETALTYAIGVASARFGAKLGAGTSGASLRTASQATKITKNILGNLDINAAKNLLIDAIQDKELFIALSKDVSKIQLDKRAFGILQSWMLSHSVSRLEENNQN